MNDLGSLIFIILFDWVFQPITLSTVSYFCIIYVTDMCSQAFSVKLLQSWIILVSKILPVHLFNFLHIKIDLNLSGNIDICLC